MKLYEELKELVKNDEAFYISNQIDTDGTHYEIFLYRLASYTSFLQPSALESRGIMFLDGVCVSRTPEKFFNLGECSQWPEHKNTIWEDYIHCAVKEDGSLISTWIDKSNSLRCKTKGSLHSEQAVMAEEYLENNSELYACLDFFTHNGYTVNLEIVSPDNRIVIAYPLSLFGAMALDRGIKKYWVEYVTDINMHDVPSMNGANGEVIEGFVYEHPDTGHKVKCKTDRYVEIHHAKDDVNNPKRLMLCVLEEGSDDLRSLFDNDELTIKYIDDFEKMVFDEYNYMVSIVEMYYKHNKDLIQKDYAIKAQDKANHISKFFSLAMSMYSGKEVKYKEFMVKNRKSIFPEIKWSIQ